MEFLADMEEDLQMTGGLTIIVRIMGRKTIEDHGGTVGMVGTAMMAVMAGMAMMADSPPKGEKETMTGECKGNEIAIISIVN